MEKSSLKIDCIVHFSFLLCIVAVITLVSTSFKLGMAAMGNETDRLALLAFKDQLVGGLLSWNASLHFCEWQGVRCGRRHQRVISLSLPAMNLGGSISPSVGNLSFLREANLFNNSLKGNIPSEFGQLRRLRSLNLNRNNLYGNIPMELGNCSSFVFLNLSYNSLSGELPSGLGDDMKNLITLSVAGNDLVGGIPSLGNLSSLENLRLEHNHFEGVVPDSLGRLSNLKIFSIQENNLSGIIPSSIYNLSSLTHVSMGRNNLSGGLAPQLGFAFPNLVTLYLTENQFNGRIPRSVSNVSGLNQLDISSNGFSGLVPDDLGKLRNLLLFDVHDNDLGLGTEGDLDFLSSLRNCSGLQYLFIDANKLGGMLPDTVANLSAQLESLYMGGNPISGSIPQGIGNLYGLEVFYFGESLLTGKLPVSIGQLQNLGQLDISLNHLSGEIPSSIGNLSRLLYLYLNGNDFRGTIPSTLRGCKDMEEMNLSLNKLGGTIPDQLVAAFQSLITLNLSHNSFNGTFPSDIRNSKNLVELYVDNNNFSGEIPEKFGEISELKILHMQENYFQGRIPRSLGSLRGLEILDLSGNNLSGPIPLELQKLPFLLNLNLSFNQLEGEVPEEGVFKNISGFSIIGNKDLCGGIPEIELPNCFDKKATEKRNGLSKKSIVVIIISLSLALISVAFIVILCWRKKSQKEMIPLSLRQQVSLFQVSYKELVEATNGFSALNFLGKGSFGSVYKGFLNQQENPVAVKVLNLENLGAVKSFIAECEVLRNIRHRNLVKLITCCSSINFQGSDFKAIVLEFMANGSLESWLHHDDGEGHSRQLDFAEMLNIAIDMANAIDYLHRHCRTPIVHRDLKPSNVLLDDDMVAHVSDFGMAKLLFCTASDLDNEQTTSSIIKGTIGYLAPECGMGDPTSPEGDIYSYGIIILEMITGKRPTDDMFEDGISLHSLCKMALPEQVEEILDSRLLEEINERGDQNMLDCLVWFTNVGVACSVEVPDKRMKIEDVVAELVAIKARLHGIHV